jgi:hypothetical protein
MVGMVPQAQTELEVLTPEGLEETGLFSLPTQCPCDLGAGLEVPLQVAATAERGRGCRVSGAPRVSPVS